MFVTEKGSAACVSALLYTLLGTRATRVKGLVNIIVREMLKYGKENPFGPSLEKMFLIIIAPENVSNVSNIIAPENIFQENNF